MTIDLEKLAAKTGRTLGVWLDLLADSPDRGRALQVLRRDHGLKLFWAHAILAEWEAQRGIAPKAPPSSLGLSRLSDHPRHAIFALLADPARRGAWAPFELAESRIEPEQRVRFRPVKGRAGERVEIGLFDKPSGQVQLTLHHRNYDPAPGAHHWRAVWDQALNRFCALLDAPWP